MIELMESGMVYRVHDTKTSFTANIVVLKHEDILKKLGKIDDRLWGWDFNLYLNSISPYVNSKNIDPNRIYWVVTKDKKKWIDHVIDEVVAGGYEIVIFDYIDEEEG